MWKCRMGLDLTLVGSEWKNTNAIGLKCLDYHILMQCLIPIGVKGLLAKGTYMAIVELCMFLRNFAREQYRWRIWKKRKQTLLKYCAN